MADTDREQRIARARIGQYLALAAARYGLEYMTDAERTYFRHIRSLRAGLDSEDLGRPYGKGVRRVAG